MATLPVQFIAELPDICQLRILSLLEQAKQLNADAKDTKVAAPLASVVASEGDVSGLDDGEVVQEAIANLVENGFAIVQAAVDRDLVNSARGCAESALQDQMSAARMGGRPETQWMDQKLRGDLRMWLKPAQVSQPGWEAIRAVTQMLLNLKHPLERAGYDVAGPPSVQLACYPGAGSAYVRHRDRSPSSPHRTVTVLCYLNPDWTPSEGGQLSICQDGEAVEVAPEGGSVVIFESTLEHEVLPAHAKRFAITVWFSEGTGGQQRSHLEGFPEVQKGEQAKEQAAVIKGQINTTANPAQAIGEPHPRVNGAPNTLASQLEVTSSEIPSSSSLSHEVPSLKPPHQRIFVSIACFRDSECRWTVKDLFRKADCPKNLFVGIVWQVDEQEDLEFAHLRRLDEEFRQQVREVRIDWREATGPCWARHRAQQMWAGEEYFLQIDSHMRFAPHWDTELLTALAAAKKHSPKAVLSSYPPPYESLGPAASIHEDSHPTILYAKEFASDGLLRLSGKRMETSASAPVPNPFWAAGFSFSRSQLIQEVPYSPHLPELFFGEEMIMAVRFFTHGWDVYAPPEALVFHQWSRSHRPFFRESRTPDLKARATSEEQVKSFLCTERQEGEGRCSLCGAPAPESYGEEYALGDVRTVRQFANACSVNFCKRQIQSRNSALDLHTGDASHEAS